MLQSNLIRGEWIFVEIDTPFADHAARMLRALRLLRLRFDAARRYAEARGPAAPHSGSRIRGARLVPAAALKWHQQMRRLDTLMLAPHRSRWARIVWRLTRSVARRQANALSLA